MKHFSFLLGSGFSVPAGYPTTSEINQKLCKIHESEICVTGDFRVWFLDGKENLIRVQKENEKLFVQKFIEFYCLEELKGHPFDYEKFYDYYMGIYNNEEQSSEFERFCEEFRGETGEERDNSNLLISFNIIFNKLLASCLVKQNKNAHNAHMCKPYPQNYSVYLHLLEYLGKSFKVHIHSLNHDLHMEQLVISDSIGTDSFSNGFEELGSPYFGEHDDGYNVRLRRFTGKFDKTFCFYKLHGSVDQYIYRDENFLEVVKSERGVNMRDAKREYNENGKSHYRSTSSGNFYPDFLIGRETKTRNYDYEYYYKPLLEHFKENLTTSYFLVVIGYGFRDCEINRYIKDYFVSRKNTVMLIIDENRPDTKFLGYGNVKLIQRGIENVSKADIEQELGL